MVERLCTNACISMATQMQLVMCVRVMSKGGQVQAALPRLLTHTAPEGHLSSPRTHSSTSCVHAGPSNLCKG